jgi:HrpA-like RNA helicase
VVNVPDYRRFPIDILHHGDEEFPTLKYFEPNESYLNDDDALCKMTAQLALKLAREEEQKQNDIGGSILCFLPGMEEIRLVHRCIRDMSGRDEKFRVQYLHSSLTSQQQGKVFEKGLKIILSTNIAETSLTIPDVKAVIDTGRERQHSLLESTSSDNFTTVVGSQLATVNISRAAAKQRAGRAGRVSAGTCYRLYSRYEFKTVLEEHTSPEMLRMELSQLVLHSLSLYHPSAGHDPLQLLQDAPDRPDASRLEQTLRSLAAQSLILYDGDNHESTQLTPLGEVVSSIPATPLLGRMLMIGLVLQSIEPAITIASLLSVPKVFMDRKVYKHNSSSSDIIKSMEDFYHFRSMNSKGQRNHPQERVFRQVQLVALQLEGHMRDFLARATAESEGGRSQHESKQYDWDGDWNANSQRIGAVVSLICCATPHIAHLVQGRHGFATRDISGSARIHNSSINFDKDRRVHWYAYKELRATKQPYLHVTTAVSPLEVALFSEASTDNTIDDWLFLIDQWVPVDLTTSSQKNMFVKLRNLLMNVLPQHITQNPSSFLANADAKQLVLLVLSAIEQQRIKK